MIDLPWPAPAKINLFLHVTGRREDGYHELQTLFQFLDVHDDLWFEPREDGVIRRCTDLENVPEDTDLMIRAAKLLRDEVQQPDLGVDICIDKKLPMGGGIGGGSSDAATTLVALNHLWSLHLPESRLRELGLQLGADVPVFVHGHAAWAEGVGEELADFSPSTPWYLLVNPGVHVPTVKIFSHSELTRDTTAIKMHTFLNGDGRNDCEPVARKCYPEIENVFEWFGPDKDARLTGTGSCVFCAFDSEAEAREKQQTLSDNWTSYVTQGLNRSPLLDRLAKEQERNT